MVFYLGLIWPGRPDGLSPRVFGADYFSNSVLYFRHHINIKYILESTYGTLGHIKNLPNNS
jgi:hypothetical protein